MKGKGPMSTYWLRAAPPPADKTDTHVTVPGAEQGTSTAGSSLSQLQPAPEKATLNPSYEHRLATCGAT